jgi:hypothetical protein
VVAEDGFLPRSFAVVGRRLVYSVGIIYLACTAGALLVAFGGITDRLIPLFAIGAFLTFTASQTGMVAHWLRVRRDPTSAERGRAHVGLLINGLGAATTATAFVVIVATKFTAGAWITFLVMPCVFVMLKGIHRYYVWLDCKLRESGPLNLQDPEPPVVIVPVQEWNRLANKALGFALKMSADVIAVHWTATDDPDADEREQRIRRRWQGCVEQPARQAGLPTPRYVVVQSPYRRFVEPLLKFIAEVEAEYPRRTVAVLVAETVKQHWWEHLLALHRGDRLRMALRQYGGSRLVIVEVPFYLEEPQLEKSFTTEEPDRARRRTARIRQRRA